MFSFHSLVACSLLSAPCSVLDVCRFPLYWRSYFSRRVDRLHPFLLSQLKRAADHASRDNAIASHSVTPGAVSGQEGTAAVAAATSRAEMHPVLYPILLLLARLRASGGEAETGAEQNEVREARLSEGFAVFGKAPMDRKDEKTGPR